MKQKITREIALPEGIAAEASGRAIKLKSANWEAGREAPKALSVSVRGNKVVIEAENATKKALAEANSLEAHLNNMAKCLLRGYKCELAIVYAHFPITLAQKGNAIEISNFGGEKKPRVARIAKGASVEVKGKEITVKGWDKEAVSQTAANLEQATRKVGKDVRRFQDGIYIVRKGHLE